MSDTPQKSQNNAKSEVEDILLALMQTPDPEPPTPPSPTRTILDDLKPYPFHDGCGGLVELQVGLNDEEVPCGRFLCHKCGKEEIVEATNIRDETADGSVKRAEIEPPSWVRKPNV